MKNRLGWPMATLAILTFSLGQAGATAGQAVTPGNSVTSGTSGTLVAEPAGPPCGQAATSPVPTFFTDEVGQPPLATADAANHYTLTAHLGTHAFNSGWPAVPTLGYSTANQKVDYLGPTIVTKKGTPIAVKIVNGLPSSGTAMFPQFDEATHANPTVLHRHGGLQPALSDGTPDQMVTPGTSRTNYYPNNQAAAPLWYHDHADGVTSYNVYAGLAGFMPNTDRVESLYNMPKGDFAKAYVLQDKSFDPVTKELCYTHASPEFFGDLPVVNGTIAPKQTVQPRRYTFTFINGSDSRFYNLTLKPADGTVGAAPRMTVVGSDSGYLLRPVKVNAQVLAPGERYTVIVDFTGTTGKWVLSNDAATPYPSDDDSVSNIDQLMRFDVTPTTAAVLDRSSIPSIIVETNNVLLPTTSLVTARLRTVQAAEKNPGEPQLGNATSLWNFLDAPTETPQLGSTEAWAMRNHSPDAHPIHEHLVEQRLVGRWPVTQWGPQDPITGNAVPLAVGAFEPPGAFESGPKDTFVSPSDYITVWVSQYTIGGISVWHCHILSHEDGMTVNMMRPLVVGSAAQNQLPVVGNMARLDLLIRRQSAT